MKLILLAVAAMLALAGCSTTGFNTFVAENLPKACSKTAQAHAAFIVVAATGTIPAKYVSKEKAAWAGVASICADPASVNADTAVVKVAEAYAAIIEAKRASN